MPELPEVEATARYASKYCVGKVIKEVIVQEDNKIFQGKGPEEIQNALEGRSIVSIGRKGKYFWAVLRESSSDAPAEKGRSGDDTKPETMVFHLGMSGRLMVKGHKSPKYVKIKHEEDAWPPRFTKLELVMDDDTRVAYTDARRFGKVFPQVDPLNNGPVSKLGPDTFSDLPELERFGQLLTRTTKPLKALLLDQEVLSGIGNWVADEVMYQACIHPEIPCSDLTEEQLKKLHDAIQSVLKTAIAVDADAEHLPKDWLFHYRWTGKTASKDAHGNDIKFLTVGSRTTAYVPALQRHSKGTGKSNKRPAERSESKKAVAGKKKAKVSIDGEELSIGGGTPDGVEQEPKAVKKGRDADAQKKEKKQRPSSDVKAVGKSAPAAGTRARPVRSCTVKE